MGSWLLPCRSIKGEADSTEARIAGYLFYARAELAFRPARAIHSRRTTAPRSIHAAEDEGATNNIAPTSHRKPTNSAAPVASYWRPEEDRGVGNYGEAQSAYSAMAIPTTKPVIGNQAL